MYNFFSNLKIKLIILGLIPNFYTIANFNLHVAGVNSVLKTLEISCNLKNGIPTDKTTWKDQDKNHYYKADNFITTIDSNNIIECKINNCPIGSFCPTVTFTTHYPGIPILEVKSDYKGSYSSYSPCSKIDVHVYPGAGYGYAHFTVESISLSNGYVYFICMAEGKYHYN